MKMKKITTYALLGGMGVVTLSAILTASASANRAPSDAEGITKAVRAEKQGGILELFDLNREEYIDLLREDISLRMYAEDEGLNIDEIVAEVEVRMTERLDKALEEEKLTQEEYEEKLDMMAERIEAHLDAEDLEDLPQKEDRGRGKSRGTVRSMR